MRYIDNGIGDPREGALFPWLRTVLAGDVVGILWQSGYFEASVLGVFQPTFQRLADEGLAAIVLVGSNGGATQSSAVHQLVDVLALPRSNALLGVISYSDGFYHPKTIHLSYRSGREVAYVGSANMTSRGINGLNVEAGIILDTKEGDPADLLSQVEQAVREWFVSRPEGLFEVGCHDDVSRLEERGVLTAEPAPRRPSDEDEGSSSNPLPRRGRRHDLPSMPGGKEDALVREPEIAGDVLIAELPGGGRWSQAAFPKWFIDNFFEVLPDTGDVLRLWRVTEAGGVGAKEEAQCGYKKSQNWYYELGLAADLGAYPPQPYKPIGVFHRIGYQKCRYTILMPSDESYRDVADCLAANHHRLNRPPNQLPRTIVPAAVLRNAWPRSWFFEP